MHCIDTPNAGAAPICLQHLIIEFILFWSWCTKHRVRLSLVVGCCEFSRGLMLEECFTHVLFHPCFLDHSALLHEVLSKQSASGGAHSAAHPRTRQRLLRLLCGFGVAHILPVVPLALHVVMEVLPKHGEGVRVVDHRLDVHVHRVLDARRPPQDLHRAALAHRRVVQHLRGPGLGVAAPHENLVDARLPVEHHRASGHSHALHHLQRRAFEKHESSARPVSFAAHSREEERLVRAPSHLRLAVVVVQAFEHLERCLQFSHVPHLERVVAASRQHGLVVCRKSNTRDLLPGLMRLSEHVLGRLAVGPIVLMVQLRLWRKHLPHRGGGHLPGRAPYLDGSVAQPSRQQPPVRGVGARGDGDAPGPQLCRLEH
mmetsp:Transcript_9508/g.17860  ORF Transcript_9508/g.17860 Transcript_9508/m.17860 type:complete len:371 (+) Transcript_9508:239-1351(+)